MDFLVYIDCTFLGDHLINGGLLLCLVLSACFSRSHSIKTNKKLLRRYLKDCKFIDNMKVKVKITVENEINRTCY